MNRRLAFAHVRHNRTTFERFAVQEVLVRFLDFQNFETRSEKIAKFVFLPHMFIRVERRVNIRAGFVGWMFPKKCRGIHVFIKKKRFEKKKSTRFQNSKYFISECFPLGN